MSDFSLSSISFHPTSQTQQVQQTQDSQPPQPPKSQSDHKPLNTSDSSRGPAVVLSGAFSQGTDRKRDSSGSNTNQGSSRGFSQSQSQSQATGQHINHVI